jgi:hypothetical protein
LLFGVSLGEELPFIFSFLSKICAQKVPLFVPLSWNPAHKRNPEKREIPLFERDLPLSAFRLQAAFWESGTKKRKGGEGSLFFDSHPKRGRGFFLTISSPCRGGPRWG